MKLKNTYRVYFDYKDKSGNKIDFTNVPWPFDIYRIIHGDSVSEVVDNFNRLYPNYRTIGVGGTFDLTDDILKKWIEWQGHKVEYQNNIKKTKKLTDLINE